MSNLKQRVISGVIMGVVFIAAIMLGGWPFTALIGIVSVFIWSEWANITLSAADDRVKPVGLIALFLTILALLFLSGTALLVAILAVVVISFGVLLSWNGGTKGIFGLLYAGGFLISMSQLRGELGLTTGLFALLFLCACVWATDIGAYFAGRAIGGPKLAPRISPNKTISGALGGVFCAVFSALLISQFFDAQNMGILFALAVILSVVSQIGDLFESHLKRKAGVKDSGSIIPGHGGVMDRVDGLVFAAICLWIVSLMFGSLYVPSNTFFG